MIAFRHTFSPRHFARLFAFHFIADIFARFRRWLPIISRCHLLIIFASYFR